MQILITERLIARFLKEDDFADFHALCSDPEVVRYMGAGKPLTPEQTRNWIAISQENYQEHGYGCFAITSRLDGQFIGFGGLVGNPSEIIYAFKKSHWGQGLALEFARSMIEIGFHRWKLPCIAASIDARNTASLRIAQKLAMTFVRSGPDEYDQPTMFYILDNPVQQNTEAQRV